MEEENRMSQARILKAQGHKHPEIAEILGVKDRTVRNYLKNLPTPRKKHLTHQGKSEKELSSIRFNFFIAKFMANHITETRIRKEVKGLVERPYVKIYANVLMFLTYLTRDPYIIKSIFETLKKFSLTVLVHRKSDKMGY